MTEGSGSSYSPEARKFLSEHIPRHLNEGMERDQAIAAAMREAREKGLRVPSSDDESAYSEAAREFIGEHIREHRKQGMPSDQAIAAAMDEARRKGLQVPERDE